MLDMAKVTSKDFVVDLGSGDGRIAIAAARRYGARALGIEYNPRLVELARREARRQGVAQRVSFIEGDIFATDFSSATVVTLYLSPQLNQRLGPILLRMKPGTRVVSNAYDIGRWRADAVGKIGGERAFFYWVVPASVAGEWRIVSGSQRYDLTLRQRFQQIEGFMVVGADRTGLAEARLEGREIHFAVNGRESVRHEFIGRVHGNRITGVHRTTGQTESRFSAMRLRANG